MRFLPMPANGLPSCTYVSGLPHLDSMNRGEAVLVSLPKIGLFPVLDKPPEQLVPTYFCRSRRRLLPYGRMTTLMQFFSSANRNASTISRRGYILVINFFPSIIRLERISSAC